MEHKSNKTIVLELYKYVIGERNSALIDTYISDDYIQHSPSLKGGKEGLREAVEYLKQMPEPKEKKSPIVCAIEDDDFVMVQLDLVFMGKRKGVIDFFRLENGKIAEHWDAIQDNTEQNEAQALTTTGLRMIDDRELTTENKTLVRRFYDDIVRQSLHTRDYLGSEYIDHDPEVVSTGRLDTYLSDKSKRDTTKVHRILGEGNLVAVQSEGMKTNRKFVFYDVLRIANNAIAEHWSVEQEIPKVMGHSNGMI